MMDHGWFKKMSAAQRVAAEVARRREPATAQRLPAIATPRLLLPRAERAQRPVVSSAVETSRFVLAVEPTGRRAPHQALPSLAPPIRPVPDQAGKPTIVADRNTSGAALAPSQPAPRSAPRPAPLRFVPRQAPPPLPPLPRLAIDRPQSAPLTVPRPGARHTRLQPLASLASERAVPPSLPPLAVEQPVRMSSLERSDAATRATDAVDEKRSAFADNAAHLAAFSAPPASAWDTEDYYRELDQLRLARQQEAVLGEL